MTTGRLLLSVVFSLFVFGVNLFAQTGPILGHPKTAVRPPADRPNILLVILDDVGVDRIGAYGEHPDPGHTPVIDGLANEGVLFRHAWSNPTCSPTRATLLTGRYGFRTGVGRAIDYTNSDFELSPGELSLPRALSPVYRTAAVGKWHLGAEAFSGPFHPLVMGFRHHSGPLSNLGMFGDGTWYDFDKAVDGTMVNTTTYATIDQVNDALFRIGQMPEPWFLWLAFSASHGPHHKPPAHLHSYDLPDVVTRDTPMHMKAETEAMDTEIGRLLDSMDQEVRERTVIIVIGDNGTDKPSTTAPFSPTHAKASPFEGGVGVPLIVSGPGVAQGEECEALVSTVDMFATCVELAGLPGPSTEDSVSFAPFFAEPDGSFGRSWVFAETFAPNGFGPYVNRNRTVREDRFKLIWRDHGAYPPFREYLYDLDADPFELDELISSGPLSPEAQAAYDKLSSILLGIER